MISFFRSIFGTKLGGILALAFVGLIAVAFALGDVSGSLGSSSVGAANAARVGDQNVAIKELETSVQNRLRAERRENPTLDIGRFVEGGGLEQTLEQIINRYALAVFGDEFGLGVSKRLVDSEINKIPQSKGIDGKFSREAFDAFLRNIGLTEQVVRADITQNMYARQLLSTTVKGGDAPESLVLPYASLILEKRDGSIAAIPAAAYLPEKPPSEAQLAAFYKANRARFTIPEKRAISYALFDKDVIAAKAKPSAAQIAKYYKDNASEFAASEIRSFSQIIAPTEAGAKAIADKIRGGQPIAAAAKSVGLGVTSQKGVTKSELASSASTAVADAVFAADRGQVATPAKAPLGWIVSQVTNVKTLGARSLAQATPDISKRLEQERRLELLAEFTTEIEDQFADGASITEVAKAQDLKIETTPKLLANGANPDNKSYRPVPEMQAILPAAFNMETDGEAQLIELIPGERFAMVSVAEMEEAAPPPLAQVKGEITSAWALDQGSKKAKVAADKVVAAVNSGKSLRDALATLDRRLPPPQKISGTRQQLTPKGERLPPPVALLFSMKKGSAKRLAAPGGNGWFIVEAAEIKRGDASKNAEMLKARRTEFGQILQQEYARQLVAAAIADIGVEKNEDAIAGLRARLTQTDQ